MKNSKAANLRQGASCCPSKRHLLHIRAAHVHSPAVLTHALLMPITQIFTALLVSDRLCSSSSPQSHICRPEATGFPLPNTISPIGPKPAPCCAKTKGRVLSQDHREGGGSGGRERGEGAGGGSGGRERGGGGGSSLLGERKRSFSSHVFLCWKTMGLQTLNSNTSRRKYESLT